MASAARITRYSPEQYLAMVREADFKSEYDGGFITAMTGARIEHNTIAVNFASEISFQFKNRPCRIFSSDVRLCVSQTGLYTYPDVMALCGKPEYSDADVDTLLNPTLIVEILSPSTESYDRGRKFGHYRRLASLMEYVMIAQDEVRVERYTRQGEDWLLSELTSLDDTLRLSSIDCAVSLREIYDKVEFAGGADGP